MNGNIIGCPVYIDLLLPAETAAFIRRVREKFDPRRAFLPAEITLTGSSGLGHLVHGQSIDPVAAEMDRIASSFAPFEASFDKVERFPGTDIYFLTVKDPAPFEAIHRAFADSSIGFQPSPYPYRPHCTLKLRSAPSDTELLELLFLDAPEKPFLLSEIAAYALPDAESCELLHSSLMTGRRRA